MISRVFVEVLHKLRETFRKEREGQDTDTQFPLAEILFVFSKF